MTTKTITREDVTRIKSFVRELNNETLECTCVRIKCRASQRNGIDLSVDAGVWVHFDEACMAIAWADGASDGADFNQEVVMPFDQLYGPGEMKAHAAGVEAVGGAYMSAERSKEICDGAAALRAA